VTLQISEAEDAIIRTNGLYDYGAATLRDAQEQLLQEKPDSEVCYFYVESKVAVVLPKILELLIAQDDDDDPDQWAPPKAASSCLDAMNDVCKAAMISDVITFADANAAPDDAGGSWQQRDAALLAFASLLTSADEEILTRVSIEKVLATVGDMTHDTWPAVRDTAVFVLGKCAEIVPDVVFSDKFFDDIIKALQHALREDEARVAQNAAWTLYEMARQACPDSGSSSREIPDSYALSKEFGDLCDSLFTAADRPDANQSNLRPAAYESLTELIRSAATDCIEIVGDVAHELLRRLQHLTKQATTVRLNGDERRQLTEQQSSLLTSIAAAATLLVSAHGLTEAVEGFLFEFMAVVLDIFAQCDSAPEGLNAAKEDALTALTSVVEGLGPNYMKNPARFAEPVNTVILESLANSAEHHACAVSVGLIGDICRCVPDACLTYSALYLKALERAVGDDDLDRSVKPQLLSCINDVAMGVGPDFAPYFGKWCDTLRAAAQLCVVDTNKEGFDDDDEIDFINSLREGILEAYTGIIVGLKLPESERPEPHMIKAIEDQLETIVSFVQTILQDNNLTEINIFHSIGLIGDLVQIYDAKMWRYLDGDCMAGLVEEGKRSDEDRTRNLAVWAEELLQDSNTRA